ncbi:MAG: hypothetical protein R8P61_24690 [Bacteroidia bacterium]|nr:hypothetical protein [Bacteroidia bacterium]
MNEASPLAQSIFDESDFWDLSHPLCPLSSPKGLEGFNFFLQWRKKYELAPAHLSVYEYLSDHGYEWGNLRSEVCTDHPYFIERKLDRLREIDQFLIGVSFAQIYLENKLDHVQKQACLATLKRRMDPKILENEEQLKSLSVLYQKFESIKLLGIHTDMEKTYWDVKYPPK